jgi:hypothetical protein
MDTAIDRSDPSKALDLANIRFQLMCASLNTARKQANLEQTIGGHNHFSPDRARPVPLEQSHL